MGTTIVYWGSVGVMAKKMETTIVYWGLCNANGNENVNYDSTPQKIPSSPKPSTYPPCNLPESQEPETPESLNPEP